MATVRQTLANHADGLVVFWMEYDDASLRVTTVGCDNASGENAYAEAYLAANGGRKVSSVFLAGSNTSIAIPQQPNNRLQLTFDPVRNRVDGVRFTTMWPRPI